MHLTQRSPYSVMCAKLLRTSIVSLAVIASAQGMETLWAVFSFNIHGDNTAAVFPQAGVLTPLGARNLYDIGRLFRRRYVDGRRDTSNDTAVDENPIMGISQFRLEADQVQVYSAPDYASQASALAFMQGLYPPDAFLNDSTADDFALLANGSVVRAPLGGYQYPRIRVPGLSDPSSILISGHLGCGSYQRHRRRYEQSTEAQQLRSETAGFYTNLYNKVLHKEFSEAEVGYDNAYGIFRYLQYQLTHDAAMPELLSAEDYQRARALADQYMLATNANVSSASASEPSMSTIAGRTLSQLILRSFEQNIASQGSIAKMTMVFGDVEPAISLAALALLPSSANSYFASVPDLGSSFIFELYSVNTSLDTVYPEASDLFVRFYFRNGSATDAPFQLHALFGNGPSRSYLSFTEFRQMLAQILVSSTEEWCLSCGSTAIFCQGAIPSVTIKQSGLGLAGAGGVGAAAALVAVSLLALIVWLFKSRIRRRLKVSGSGGFRGSQKMASDPDVSFTPAVANFDIPGNTTGRRPGGATKGHERTGSWEMEHKNVSTTISEPADNGDEVILDSEPVRPRETV